MTILKLFIGACAGFTMYWLAVLCQINTQDKLPLLYVLTSCFLAGFFAGSVFDTFVYD